MCVFDKNGLNCDIDYAKLKHEKAHFKNIKKE